MFAVKGWNVDASSLKPQAQGPKANETKQGKKRKRGGDGAAEKSEDVGKLWDQHIEGKKPVKAAKKGEKEQKGQKLEKSDKYASAEKKAGAAKEEKSAEVKPVVGDVDAIKAEKKAKKKERKEKNRETKQSDEISQAQPGAPESKDTAPQSKPTKTAPPPKVPALPPTAKLTPMQSAMRQKLISARFRHLNQTLYTEPSTKALDLFDQNPEMFEDYHSGFRQQVTTWPENPVDNFIATIQARGAVRLQSQKKAFKKPQKPEPSQELPPLPRTRGTAIIADLGCGDARLAHTLKSNNLLQNLQVKVLSYDLHSPSSLVTKADISALPTADGSVDVAIFCLALMGTNWISFIEEAYRILHWKGELWVSEIKSRFGRVGGGKPKVVEHSVGGKRKAAALKKATEAKKRDAEEVNESEALAVEVDGVETPNQETDVSGFVDVLRRRGFLLKDGEKSIDLSNKMFVKMEFIKAAPAVKGKNAEKEGERKPIERFKKAKFLDEKDKDDVATDDEGKVLKPCLYKIR